MNTFGEKRDDSFKVGLHPVEELVTQSPFIRDRSTHQAHVLIGTRAYDFTSPKRIPLYLLNNMVGGPGMSARLGLALRERNALIFLNAYLEKLAIDNHLMAYFEDFFRLQDKNSLNILRDKLNHFYWDNTAVSGAYEPPRIYNKIINIFAYIRRKKGTDTGQVSEGAITLADIRYNNTNWRDKKDKSMTRQAFRELAAQQVEDTTTYLHYSIEKAKRFVRMVESDCSEVHRFIPKYTPSQAHHIFMASDFPELADCPENIICLTPTQHYKMAHPNNKTSIVDLDYQIVCLLCKLDSIEINNRNGKDDYSLVEFINVLNTGLGTAYFTPQMDYEEVKYGIIKQAYYHEALSQR